MSTPDMDHQQYMQEALARAEEALSAGEFPVGCVMVERDRVVAAAARINSGVDGNEMDHAEILALRSLISRHPRPDLSRVTLYSTLEPCLMCFSTLILSGIRRIVYGYEDVMGGGVDLDLTALTPLYAAMEVRVEGGVRRAECLALFTRFFQDEKNRYWRDSLLARHALSR